MPLPKPDLATELIHVDDPAHAAYGQGRGTTAGAPVAPSIVTSTTFRAPHPDTDLGKRLQHSDVDWQGDEVDVYSRMDSETRHRAELVMPSMGKEPPVCCIVQDWQRQQRPSRTFRLRSWLSVRGILGFMERSKRTRVDANSPCWIWMTTTPSYRWKSKKASRVRTNIVMGCWSGLSRP